MKIRSKVLSPGEAKGKIMVLSEPLSFWGAFDPRTGMIVDTHHPQRGECLKDRIVLMPETRGSGSAPGAIAEAIRRNTAPSAVIMIKADVNLAIGSFIAATLYGRRCPILSLSEADYERLATASVITVADDGTIDTDE